MEQVIDVDDLERKDMDMEDDDVDENNIDEEVANVMMKFPPVDPRSNVLPKDELRKVAVPSHRISPLKAAWKDIVGPLVEQMGLQVRMNVQTKHVELKIGPGTKEISALQKGEDFVRAFVLGFELRDAIALLRMDDLFIDGFEIQDVKTLHGEHLSRAIGRMVGKDGQTKYAIENTTRTRIVIAETRIHILGTYADIHVARDALVSLILGSPPNKVYAKLKLIASRMRDR